MAHKAGMSEVKFKVRHNTLLLREFTVEQMVRATGLKPESVRTELQRMRQEGLLASAPLAEKRRGRGGRPALYKLTPDPEKRLALSREVESFFPEPPQPTRPTSRHYLVASRILDRIAAGQYKDDRECEALLQEARERLDFACYDEGEPEGLIRAYIDRERARLKYLCANDETAEALFHQVRDAFVSAELHDEVAKVDEYLACISVRRQWVRRRMEASTPQSLARSTLEALQAAPVLSLADRPLVTLLTELLRSLEEFARDQVLAEAQKVVMVSLAQIAETGRSEVRMAVPDLGERRPSFEEPERWGYPEARPLRMLEEFGERRLRPSHKPHGHD
jgi:DNA-binding transcriptional ArsR family regulator